MENWNTALYLALNAPASPDPATLIAAKIGAQYLVYLAAFLAVCLWVRGSRNGREALVSIGAGLLAAFAVSWIIGLLRYHPRPFVVGLGHTFLLHASDSSFPSDHTTFLWTFAFGLLATHAWRKWAWMLVLAGLVTAWARIYVGIHYPFDMVGSLLVAALGAAVAFAVHARVAGSLLSVVEWPYEASLRASHLPTAIFPRRIADR